MKKRIQQYLDNFRESIQLYRWAWGLLKTPVAVKWSKRMLVLLTITVAFEMISPRLVGGIISGLQYHDGSAIIWAFAGWLACYFVERFVWIRQAIAREWLIDTTWSRLDEAISQCLFNKALGQHRHENALLSPSNIEKGRSAIFDGQSHIVFDALPAVERVILMFLLVVMLSPFIAMLLAATFVMHVAWMVKTNQRVLTDGSLIDRNLRRWNRYRTERWEKIERVKTSAKELEELETMTTRFDDIMVADRTLWTWFIRQEGYRGTIGGFSILIAMGYGAYQVYHGIWSLGTLYPLLAWSGDFVRGLWEIGHIERKLSEGLPRLKSMREAFNIPCGAVDVPGAIAINDGPIRIEFRNVSMAYQTRKHEEENPDGGELDETVKNVTFCIEPGEKVALIGPSGAGKTTISALLMRWMNPNKGAILINGQDLRGIEIASWMRQIGYVPQRSLILDGTFRYNLLYSLHGVNEHMGDEELWRLMRLLKVDFEERLVHGLETRVGRDGIELSGGQAQRVMLAAAVAKRPRFMIIDEATSSLDSTTEKQVQKGLATVLTPDVGALIIAHRLSTVRKICGKFIVLKNSAAIHNGDSQIEAIAPSFEELYQISPTFRQLAQDQEIVLS